MNQLPRNPPEPAEPQSLVVRRILAVVKHEELVCCANCSTALLHRNGPGTVQGRSQSVEGFATPASAHPANEVSARADARRLDRRAALVRSARLAVVCPGSRHPAARLSAYPRTRRWLSSHVTIPTTGAAWTIETAQRAGTELRRYKL